MKKYFEMAAVAVTLLICMSVVLSSAYNTAQTLEDYRKFVDYMEETNEPFEVACETDYYTTLMQEERQGLKHL